MLKKTSSQYLFLTTLFRILPDKYLFTTTIFWPLGLIHIRFFLYEDYSQRWGFHET